MPLDWENLAEEIESLGRSQRHELRSRLAVILEHLMKLEHSPGIDPRTGWMDTSCRERLNVEDLLRNSPSLKNQLASRIGQLKLRVTCLATASLFGYGERVETLPPRSYTEDQVLGSLAIPPRPHPNPPPLAREGMGGRDLGLAS